MLLALSMLGCTPDKGGGITVDEGHRDGSFVVANATLPFLSAGQGAPAGTGVGMGDLDGDGLDETLVDSVLRTHDGEWPAVVSVPGPLPGDRRLDTEADVFGVVGAAETRIRLVTDLDRDGDDDLVVGSVLEDAGVHAAEAVFIVPGPPSGEVWYDATDPTSEQGGVQRIQLNPVEGWLGDCPVAAGDVSRDGAVDLVTCGRYYAGGMGVATVGAAVLLEGPFDGADGLVNPRTLFAAPADGVGFASTLAVDDLSGGGLDWVVLGATGGTVDGVVVAPSLSLYDAPPTGIIEASDATFVYRADPDGGTLGEAFATGDLNGDGYPDIAAIADPTGETPRGVWVLYGPPTRDQDFVDGVLALEDPLPSGEHPPRLLLPGDIDGDGLAEVVVGAAEDGMGGPGGGRVTVAWGPQPGSELLTWYGDGGEVTRPDGDIAAHQETLGASLASGDEDGDGLLDLVLGAPGFSTDYADLSPGAYVVPGTWY